MSGPPPPPLIAHRGWARRYPENTVAAVRGALEAGAGWVEVDVQLSSDGVPHLFHDHTLERLTGASGALHERSAAELRALAAAEPRRFKERFAAERVATLADLVELLADFPAGEAFVELKRSSIEVFGAEGVLDAVLPVLAPVAERCWLISFDLPVLASARTRCDLRLGPVLEAWKERVQPAVLDLEPEVVFCNVRRLPRGGALELPAGRLAVYEVDDPERARRLLDRGASWIETFAIGEMLAALGATGAGA